MAELATNRAWGSGPQDCRSQYARMIPGTSATASRSVSTTSATHDTGTGRSAARATLDNSVKPAEAISPIRRLQPHRAGDRFVLFQLVAADLIFLVLAWGAASLFLTAWAPSVAYLPIFAVLVTLFGFSQGIYQRAGDPFPAGLIFALARSTLFATGLVCIAAWDRMGLLTAAGVFAGSVATLALSRQLRQVEWKRRRRQTESRRVLIIGGGPIARSIAQAMRSDPLQRATVCGFVDDDQPLSPPVLGRIADLDWLARSEFIDEVILALPGQPGQTRRAAEAAFRNRLDIRAVPDLPLAPWSGSAIDRIGEVPVITLHREPLPSTALFVKRLLDVSGAAFGLVLASPLMAVIALLIRLDSGGPVIYSAERTGAKGRRFLCYKFRSMVTDAASLKEQLRGRNQRHGPIFKIEDDPRITRIGRILRRYSLDELPQLWNVLSGEMSLVGPRPHPVDEVNHYELQQFRRLDVKPGITGLWQIMARDCPSFELNMHLDLTYIENWSLRLDLRILANTVRVLFVPEGA
jgi:exopolysaccharide biosynthesis polyprenyl glycosylphosphotransferase